MVHNTFRRFFHSVFTQLLLICLVAGIIIIFLVGGFFSHLFRKSAQAHLEKNVIQYVKYVVKDLGKPPSFERAAEITRESGMQIRYEGPNTSWSTSDKVPTLQDLKQGNPQRDCITICRIYHGKHPIVIRQGSDTFVIILKPEHALVSGWEMKTVVLILLLTVVVLVTYLTIRHILRPLKFLSEGVQQISSGRLDHQVPMGRSTEFGKLAQGFNAMTAQIRNMLHAKEQLLLDVSHELRSPLTRMKVALAMLDDARVKESMTDDIRDMETMVSEILEDARLRNSAGQLKIEMIQVKPLFEDMDALYSDQPPGLLVGSVPDDASFTGDLMLIKMVLNNIIANALKYSPSDGEPVRLTYMQEEGCTVIWIQDRGIGIPEEDLPYLFEPFYRVDKSRSKRTGGYGLGLSLCKTIMDAHREKIEVRSTLGVGTTISLFFHAREDS